MAMSHQNNRNHNEIKDWSPNEWRSLVQQHHNKEPASKCMYCGAVKANRAMARHIQLSDDNLHGPRDEVPDDYDLDKCDDAGTVDVTIDRVMSDHSRLICRHCGKPCTGKSGLGVHIARKDDPTHDIDGKPDYDKHMLFPAFEDGTILVPNQKWKEHIDLTEDEIEDGFELVVSEELEEVSDININPPPTREELLEDLREEFNDYLLKGEMVDPVEAYGIVEDRIKDMQLPEEN